jgi:hypothetical protein
MVYHGQGSDDSGGKEHTMNTAALLVTMLGVFNVAQTHAMSKQQIVLTLNAMVQLSSKGLQPGMHKCKLDLLMGNNMTLPLSCVVAGQGTVDLSLWKANCSVFRGPWKQFLAMLDKLGVPVETSLGTTRLSTLMLFCAWCRDRHPAMWACGCQHNYNNIVQCCAALIENYILTGLPERQLPLNRLVGPSGTRGRRVDPLAKQELLDKIADITTHRRTAVHANRDIIHDPRTISSLDLAHCMLYHQKAKAAFEGTLGSGLSAWALTLHVNLKCRYGLNDC